MIRRAKQSDYESCLSIAKKLFPLYPSLIPNQSSLKKIFTECVSGAQNFVWVSEKDGVVCGCLLAITFDHIWAQKKSSSVLMWSCEKSGDGISLLREYAKWLDERPAIRRGGFQFDIDIDVRIYPVLERAGFKRSGGCFLQIKGE